MLLCVPSCILYPSILGKKKRNYIPTVLEKKTINKNFLINIFNFCVERDSEESRFCTHNKNKYKENVKATQKKMVLYISRMKNVLFSECWVRDTVSVCGSPLHLFISCFVILNVVN